MDVLVLGKRFEDILNVLLRAASGTIVLAIRDGKYIYFMTELGGKLIVFASRIPRSPEVREIYEEMLKTGKYIYVDEKGHLVSSEHPPPPAISSGIMIVVEATNVYMKLEEKLVELREIVRRRKRSKKV